MKTILITGASSGFGFEMVREFWSHGWNVIATLRRAHERAHLFRECHGPRLHLVDLDVTLAEERKALVHYIQDQHGGSIDCLVNNAGVGLFGSLEDCDESQIVDLFHVNTLGLMFLTRALLPFIRNSKGRIINISSLLGFSGLPLASVYAASKHAIEGLSESLAYELAPHGVQVSVVSPGGYRTSFAKNLSWSAMGPHSVYRNQTRTLMNLQTQRLEKPGRDPGQMARLVYRLTQMKRMPLKVRSGLDAHLVYTIRSFLPEALMFRLFSRLYQKMFSRTQKSAAVEAYVS